MAAYGGRSRLLLKATGSSVTMGVKWAPRLQAWPCRVHGLFCGGPPSSWNPPQRGAGQNLDMSLQTTWVIFVRRLKLLNKGHHFKHFFKYD